MTRPLDPKKIKSANRVLEIFQYFNAERSQATVMEVAREFGYPQSSTSELLSCLVELGFLRRDRHARTYRLTAKVALLGAWVQPRLFRQGRLLPMMDELAAYTGSAVVVARDAGLAVEAIHVVAGAETAPVLSPSLLHSAVGRLLLSTMDRSLIRKLAHRLNSECEPGAHVRCDDLLAEIDGIRRQGFSVDRREPADHRPSWCAVLLPQTGCDEPIALAIARSHGEAGSVDATVRALRNAVATWLGPVLAHQRIDQADPARTTG